MCGEHMDARGYLFPGRGSSPHVRGAPFRLLACLIPSGIIPACAGSTMGPRPRRRPGTDHPRMCGEHSAQMARDYKAKGSSPHVRGAPSTQPAPHVRHGIIPACAGSTISVTFSRIDVRDHPRMCGEHSSTARVSSLQMGSSPHVRGALLFADWIAAHCGIIPACAGSTRYTTLMFD